MKRFMEISPDVFEKSGRQTHTHRQTDAAALCNCSHVHRLLFGAPPAISCNVLNGPSNHIPPNKSAFECTLIYRIIS